MKEDLAILKDFDNETALQLIESAYQYLLDKNSLPLHKLTFNVRAPFSAIYEFLRKQPAKQINKIENLQVSKEIKQAIKDKLYLMYAQNYQKVGLLTNYKLECMNPKAIEVQSETDIVQTHQSSQILGLPSGLDYASCQWKINVVLSTNYLNKVLRPEIMIEIQTAQNEKIMMTVSVEKFEELRRQVAYLIRYAQQIECIRFLNV